MQSFAILAFIGAVAGLPVYSKSARAAGSHFGDMTFHADFASNACNIPSAGMAAAVNAPTFDRFSPVTNGIKNPNANTLCGKPLTITNPETGGVATVIVVDRMAATDANAIDVSAAAFAALGISSDLGRVHVEWALP